LEKRKELQSPKVPKVKVTREKTRIKLKLNQKLYRNLDKRPQKIGIAKATNTNVPIDRNRDLDEVAPAAVADTETIPRL
jgi:hypothetical protein